MSANSSCPPIGISRRNLRTGSADLIAADVLVFYTDGGTKANRSGEECGTERLCSVVRQGSSLPAEKLMSDIFRTAADFCQVVGFRDDVTILVVKCNFDGSQQLNS
jgi:serine phosphatase RsbU (regulator of sigma subunit)